jgi:ribA/ribD-fused uncharacterized protein
MYNIDQLINEYNSGKKIKYLFFWGHQPNKDGLITSSCFSQWWISPFTVNNIVYKTSEHWMMAQKALLFEDKEVYEKIVTCNSPAEAKKLGREIHNFDETIWLSKRFDIVVNGNLYKFKQHDDLKTYLINTNDRVLVEASPVDKIWGIGLTSDSEKVKNPNEWNGLNLLGFALMTVRDILIKEK